MIERRGFPVLFAVTGLALGAEYALMIVVFLMTGHAIGLEFVFIEVPRMAALTFDGCMLAGQRVFGIPIMAERHLFPIRFSVARDAFLSKVAFVRIVFLMAGQAF